MIGRNKPGRRPMQVTVGPSRLFDFILKLIPVYILPSLHFNETKLWVCLVYHAALFFVGLISGGRRCHLQILLSTTCLYMLFGFFFLAHQCHCAVRRTQIGRVRLSANSLTLSLLPAFSLPFLERSVDKGYEVIGWGVHKQLLLVVLI